MPGPRGSLSPQRGNVETFDVIAVFDIGASGAHTKVYGGGMSVARTAAGKYTVNFTEWGPAIVDLQVTHWAQDAAVPLHARPTDGSFTQSATAASVKYETYGGVNDDTLTELPSGDRVTITATFLKTI